MKYTIFAQAVYGIFKIVEWEAESAEQAVEEFLELNPAYANGRRGTIFARIEK